MPEPSATQAGSNRSLLILMGVLLVVVFAAIAFWQRDTPERTNSKPDEATLKLELSPQGDQGLWLRDSYRNGADGTFATTDTVCAVQDDVVVLRTETQQGPRVSGRNLRQGFVLWEHPNTGCNSNAGLPGVGVFVTTFPTESARFIDPATGTTNRSLPATVSGQPVAAVGDLVVFDGLDKLFAADEKKIRWTWAADSRMTEVVALPEARLGVATGLTDKVYALDATNGEELWRRDTLPVGERHVWASDGYVERVNQSDPTYAFYDLATGKEVDRTVGSSQYPFTPSPGDGVTFPIRDHVAAGSAVGVSADGRVALFEGKARQDFTRVGRVDLPDSILDLQALTADGTSFLVSKRDPEAIALLDERGKTLWQLPGDYWELSVEDGYLVTTTNRTTTVFLPNER